MVFTNMKAAWAVLLLSLNSLPVMSASTDTFLPTGSIVGQSPQINTTAWSIQSSIALDSQNILSTIDYGNEVAGYPYFDVSALSGPVQIEVKYSEMFDGLSNVWSDGPFGFDSGLANTFRVETFNITQQGRVQSYFIQGGQRWQSIQLLTPGNITFGEVGFVPTIDQIDFNNLPGNFNCSNPAYNEIWKLGARAVSAACINSGTQSTTWNLTTEGAYIRGQRPALSAVGNMFQNYSLSFSSKIVRGGTGWATNQPFGTAGLVFLLVSELPKATTFVNTNKTLTPANSIVLAYGYELVNQTTLEGSFIDTFPVPFNVTEGTWHNISSTLDGDFVSATVDGHQVFNISLGSYGVTLSGGFTENIGGQGSWGFGPWQDQVAIVKDVEVHALNGTLLYESPMTDEAILSEYGVASNTASLCMDGAKRDRLVWLADFLHTTRIIASSTNRSDHVAGTMKYLIDWQSDLGELSVSAPLGYDAALYQEDLASGSYGLPDYQILGLLSFTEYFLVTADTDSAKLVWPGLQKQISFLLDKIDNSTHLVQLGAFIGPVNGTATSAALVQALNGAAVIAEALGYTNDASQYRSAASDVAAAVNKLLFNPTLGTYSVSTSDVDNFSAAGIAFAITSGIAGSNFTSNTTGTGLISVLNTLQVVPGYKDSSSTSSSTADISPNINGFLIRALLLSNHTTEAKYLLDNLWMAMVSNEQYRTGASWEYVGQDLSPGLGLFTSLSHPWGGAPTYILPEFAAGIRTVDPGYKTWKLVVPSPSSNGTLGLSYAEATVPTKFGSLYVRWEMLPSTSGNKSIQVDIMAPAGTSGSLTLASLLTEAQWQLNGNLVAANSSSINISAGNSVVVISV